jgi:recombination protein RecR
MLDKLPSLQRLVRNLQLFPTVSSKNIFRATAFFLEMSQEKAEQFCYSILEAKKKIMPCKLCFAWQEIGDKCLFCFDEKRDKSVICVVESWQELLAFEQSKSYNGMYHVLGGSLCPLEGRGPEDLNADQLIARLDKGVLEIILGFNNTPEGEATAAYISNLCENLVKITCLARGLPVGSTLEFTDRVTLAQALQERRPY